MTKRFKKPRGFRIILLFLVLISLAGAFFIIPPRLVDNFFNQTLEEGFFASVNTRETKLTPFLDQLTLLGVSVIPRDNPDRPLTIEELTIKDLDRWKLFKALLGFGDDLLTAMGEGEMLIRNLSDNGPLGGIDRIHLGTVSVKGLSLELFDPQAPPQNLDYITAEALKITDLDFASTDGQALALDSLSIFDLKNSVIGSLTVSGLSMRRDIRLALDNDHATIAGLRLLNISRALTASQASTKAAALLGAFEGLDLASLSIEALGQPNIYLEKALVDTIGGQDNTSGQRYWKLNSLTVDLGGLNSLAIKSQNTDPVFLAFLEALGPKPTADIEIKGTVEGTSRLSVDVADRFELELSLSTTGLDSATVESPSTLLFSVPTLSLGPGKIQFTNKGLAKDFLPALNSIIFNSPMSPGNLSEVFDLWLASLEKPDSPKQHLNRRVLAMEMDTFLSNPSKISLLWDPPAPGFPKSLLQRIGGFTALISEISANQSTDLSSLAEKYKYDIFETLNLSLEINDRPPVSVYVP
ncbi:MAG: hypothetical protein LBT47_01700 [Deltaproteobacteria bacterium]|jgi:hypothetical protein|nr:hypothetical protein [Deltaproteobacteria bacterium]